MEPDGTDAFETIGSGLARALESEFFALYDVALAPEGPRLGRYAGNLLPDDVFRGFFDQTQAAAPDASVLYDPVRPEALQRDRALSLQRLVELKGPPPPALTRELIPRHGLTEPQQLRVLVCDGPSLVAFVGVLRHAPYDAEDERRLQRLVPLLRQRLLDEQLLEHAPALNAALAAALEALGSEAWVLSLKQGGGFSMVHANTAGRAARDAAPRETAECLSLLLGGRTLPGWRLTRFTSRAIPEHALVVRRRPEQALGGLVQKARRRWALTGRQTQVLERLARGLANKTIASELGCAQVTVEAHLTALFRRLGVASRAEALALLLELD